ncbi:V1A vasopressin receptor binding [Mactra antiquata]
MTPYGVYDCWGTFEPEWSLTLYITVFTALVYIIPSLILIFCYGGICVTVWKCNKVGEKISRFSKRVRNTRRQSGNETQLEFQNGGKPLDTVSNCSMEMKRKSKRCVYSHEGDLNHSGRSFDSRRRGGGGISQAKLKTIRLTLTVILCYDVCWTPFFVAQMWAAYDINAPFTGMYMLIFINKP